MAFPQPEPILSLTPRRPQVEARFNVYAALGATSAAAFSCVLYLSLSSLPPRPMATIQFGLTPFFAGVALLVLSRRGSTDPWLRWFSFGLALSVIAMVLQVISFESLVGSRGPFGTGDQASAQLYLLFHLAIVVAVVAALLKVSLRWRWPFFGAGLVVLGLAASNGIPGPQLLNDDMGFTSPLLIAEAALAVTLVAEVVLWVKRGDSTPLQGWVAVCLLLLAYEVTLNMAAAQRFDPLWWSSLLLRAAAFGTLAVGLIYAVTRRLVEVENYAESELSNRERELRRSLFVGEVMVSNASKLSQVSLPTDVASLLADDVAQAGEIADVWVFDVLVDGSGLRCLHGAEHPAEPHARIAAAAQLARPFMMEPAIDANRRPALAATVGPLVNDHESLVILPMRVAETVVGVVVGASAQPLAWAPWTEEVLVGLVGQGATALSRARLFEREHLAAEALQRALLPERLPRHPLLELAGGYVAGERGTQVGGDWYDCIELPDGRVALIVGDVMGRGLQAAILMGRLRDASRVLASVEPSPEDVLNGLNDVLLSAGTQRIATVVYALIDPTAQTADIAVAGHVPPVVVAPDGVPRLLDRRAWSPLLGLPTSSRDAIRVDFHPTSMLVLYTDGLVEERSGMSDGVQNVMHASSNFRSDQSLDGLVERLIDGRPAGGLTDDVAILIARGRQ